MADERNYSRFGNDDALGQCQSYQVLQGTVDYDAVDSELADVADPTGDGVQGTQPIVLPSFGVSRLANKLDVTGLTPVWDGRVALLQVDNAGTVVNSRFPGMADPLQVLTANNQDAFFPGPALLEFRYDGYLQKWLMTDGGLGLPIGMIVIQDSSTASIVRYDGLNQWLLPCDGQAYPQSQYPTLFKLLGTNYNLPGDAKDTFRVPGKVVITDDYLTSYLETFGIYPGALGPFSPPDPNEFAGMGAIRGAGNGVAFGSAWLPHINGLQLLQIQLPPHLHSITTWKRGIPTMFAAGADVDFSFYGPPITELPTDSEGGGESFDFQHPAVSASYFIVAGSPKA